MRFTQAFKDKLAAYQRSVTPRLSQASFAKQVGIGGASLCLQLKDKRSVNPQHPGVMLACNLLGIDIDEAVQ